MSIYDFPQHITRRNNEQEFIVYFPHYYYRESYRILYDFLGFTYWRVILCRWKTINEAVCLEILGNISIESLLLPLFVQFGIVLVDSWDDGDVKQYIFVNNGQYETLEANLAQR